MPNSPSAKKRLRQSEKSRLRNRMVKTTLRGTVRKVRETAESGKTELLGDQLKAAARELDQAAAKRVIHKNKASRLKSRLNRLAKAAASAAK